MGKKRGASTAGEGQSSPQKDVTAKVTRPSQLHTTQIITTVAKSTGLSAKVVEQVLRGAAIAVNEALGSGVGVRWTPVGIFSVVERKARNGRNPRTGERMDIPASKGVRFKAAKPLLEKVQAA